MTDTPTPPDGWYPDPAGGGGLRRWDGTAWTDEVRLVDGSIPAAAPEPTSPDAVDATSQIDDAPPTRDAEHSTSGTDAASAFDASTPDTSASDAEVAVPYDGAPASDASHGEVAVPHDGASASDASHGEVAVPYDGGSTSVFDALHGEAAVAKSDGSGFGASSGEDAAPDDAAADASDGDAPASDTSYPESAVSNDVPTAHIESAAPADTVAEGSSPEAPAARIGHETTDAPDATTSVTPGAAAGAAALAAAAANTPPASGSNPPAPPAPVLPAAPSATGEAGARTYAGAPSYPGTAVAGGYPGAPAVPQGAAPRRDIATNTAWIWVLVLLPLAGLVTLFVFDWDSYIRDSVYAGLYADPLAPSSTGATVLTAVSSLLSIVLGAATVLFAYLDWRALKSRGIERPFHWAWSFFVLAIGSGLVYIIGRSVIVRRQTGKGLAPLWAAIAVTVVTWIAISIWVVMLLTLVFSLVQELQYTYG